MISLGGTFYITFIVITQMKYWRDNPTIVVKGSVPLSQLSRPAMTFCHSGGEKYNFMARLVDYIDPNKTIPKEIFEIRNEAIKVQAYKLKQQLGDDVDICSTRRNDYTGEWKEIKSFSFRLKDKIRKRCEVIFYNCYNVLSTMHCTVNTVYFHLHTYLFCK